jgi:DNA helicase HerA-like ATPase
VAPPKTKLKSFGELVDYLEHKLLLQGAEDEDDDGRQKGGDQRWLAGQARGTREALIRRLRGAQKHLAHLVRGDLSSKERQRAQLDVLGSQKQVHVIDIHQLAPLAQMFVVGVVLKGLFTVKEQGRGGKLFVVLDELNKYAPAEGQSPIKEVLLDIAERGRSLGIILIGAQQTASEVERRIVSNAAVRVAGRLDAAEAERPEYRFMPASTRLRTTILAPGTMIVHQPDVPTPMLITFPFPAWATRAQERSRQVSDLEAVGLLR